MLKKKLITKSNNMKRLLIVFLCLVLVSCSSQFTYKNLDWLIHWYVDDYIELTTEQEQLFDQHFANWHRWHQSYELTQYSQQLSHIQSQLNSGTATQQVWAQHIEQGISHWYRFRDKVAPDLLDIARQLSPQQVEFLFRVLDKQNEEDQQEYQKYQNEQQQRRIKRVKKQLKRWIGKPSQQQLSLISDYAKQVEYIFPLWMEYRITWQAELKQVLLNKNNPSFEKQFMSLMLNPEHWQSAEYKQKLKFNREQMALLFANLSNTLSDKQQRKLNKEINGIKQDLTELAQARL